MKLFKVIAIGTLLTLSTLSHSGEDILWKNDGDNKISKSVVLNKVLSNDKNRGYAGVAPICNVNGKNYILLSRERSNGNSTGTWCDGGGKVDAEENLGTAALREFYEETSRVYDYREPGNISPKGVTVTKFDPNSKLFQNSRACYNNEYMTAFLDVDYKKRQVFMDAFNQEYSKPKKEFKYCEKDDFQWVDINSLCSALPKGKKEAHDHYSINVKVLNDDGSFSEKQLKIRNFFAKTLLNSKPILKKYTTKDAVAPVPAVPAPAVLAHHVTPITSLQQISTVNFKKNTLVLLDLDENVILDIHHAPAKYKHLIDPKKGYRLIEEEDKKAGKKGIAQIITDLKISVGGDLANVTVLGLTKRGIKKHGHFDMGHKHLQENNVPLSRKRFEALNGIPSICGNKKAGFWNGVICTAGQDKGVYLEDFLKQANLKGINFKPSHIVMSDDRPENLDAVNKYAQKIGVPMEAYLMTGVNNLK